VGVGDVTGDVEGLDAAIQHGINVWGAEHGCPPITWAVTTGGLHGMSSRAAPDAADIACWAALLGLDGPYHHPSPLRTVEWRGYMYGTPVAVWGTVWGSAT
jgi:hypothetical protein